MASHSMKDTLPTEQPGLVVWTCDRINAKTNDKHRLFRLKLQFSSLQLIARAARIKQTRHSLNIQMNLTRMDNSR